MKELAIEFDIQRESNGDIILKAADLVVPIVTDEQKQDFEETGIKMSYLLDECIIEFIRTESPIHAKLPNIIFFDPIKWKVKEGKYLIQPMADYQCLFATWNQ